MYLILPVILVSIINLLLTVTLPSPLSVLLLPVFFWFWVLASVLLLSLFLCLTSLNQSKFLLLIRTSLRWCCYTLRCMLRWSVCESFEITVAKSLLCNLVLLISALVNAGTCLEGFIKVYVHLDLTASVKPVCFYPLNLLQSKDFLL